MSEQTKRWLEVVSHLDPRYGGLSAAVPALAQRIAELDGMDVSLAAFCAPAEQFQPAGFDVAHLTFWPASRKQWVVDLVDGNPMRSDFRQQLEQVDGVHIHGLWEQSTLVAANAARELKIPHIISAHGMLEPWALNNKRIKKLIYSRLFERDNIERATCLHALSRTEAKQYREFGGRAPIAIIPNGVEIPETHEPEPFVELFPHLRGKRIVLFLGRLHPKKGLDLLIETWRDLSIHYPQAHLVLAGPDCEGTQVRLEQFVTGNCLTETVTFAGMLRDSMKWSALAAAEAFVLPSFSEGLSVSVLEAMGMGVPVIVTKACNMPEAEEQHAGWQIETTAHELRSALHALLANCVCRNREIGARGAALVASRYTWDRVACKMAEVYRWLTGGPEPQSVDVIFPEVS